ncbi:hypothetical protein [Rhizobium leguminosarum]
MHITRIKYDIGPYIGGVRALRAELERCITSVASFPIARFFELLPVMFRSPDDRLSLEKRGDGLFTHRAGIFYNDSGGEVQNVTVQDAELRSIELEIPQILAFEYQVTASKLALSYVGQSSLWIRVPSLRIWGDFAPRMPLRLRSWELTDSSLKTNLTDFWDNDVVIDGQLQKTSGGLLAIRRLFAQRTSHVHKSWEVSMKECLWKGERYSEGSIEDHNGTLMECIEGGWRPVEERDWVAKLSKWTDEEAANFPIPPGDDARQVMFLTRYADPDSIYENNGFLHFKAAHTQGQACTGQWINYRIPVDDVLSLGNPVDCSATFRRYLKITYRTATSP